MQPNENMKQVDPCRESPMSRYHRDPVFKTLVDVLHHHMLEAAYTPTELREACHLAACRYEEMYVRPILIDSKEPFKWNLRLPADSAEKGGK